MKAVTLFRRAAVVALASSLLGCSLNAYRVVPGSSAADVKALAGTPSEQRPLPGGVKAWYYEMGPQGWTTYRVRLDANDRVLDVEQVLTEPNFRTRLTVNSTTRSDMLESFGRPALVTRFPNLAEEVWTYRYLEGTREMLNDIHLEAGTGIVKSYSMYPDPAYSVTLA
jgi:hypothetical protein